jgi:hypothetical protein
MVVPRVFLMAFIVLLLLLLLTIEILPFLEGRVGSSLPLIAADIE